MKISFLEYSSGRSIFTNFSIGGIKYNYEDGSINLELLNEIQDFRNLVWAPNTSNNVFLENFFPPDYFCKFGNRK